MIQTVTGRKVYVIELEEIPKPPIAWDTEEERPYALALQDAIENDMIKEPGKYGIELKDDVPDGMLHYTVHLIVE